MKIRKGNIPIYIIIVIIPVIILSLSSFFKILHDNQVNRKNDALWIASVYQKNWDQFISETTTSLKILSLSAKENLDSPQKMQPLLIKVYQDDLRYGGLFLLDPNGNLMTGTAPLRGERNFTDLKFIQEVIQTKDTVISNQVEILQNNQRIIGLATPVLDENHQLQAIIVADLRMDYMKNLMRVLTPDTKLMVINDESTPIIQLNTNNIETNQTENWVTQPMDHLPWCIKVKIADISPRKVSAKFLQLFIMIFIVAHLLYLCIQYILLKIQTLKERKQNELQKLELVGTLAASTAHEIRNPLTGVKGLIQLLSEKYTDKQDSYYFEVINSELNRINEIVSEFLILGKPTAQLREDVNITATLNELKPIIISEANSRNIECVWTISQNSIMVECIKDQLKQVILNLTKNAIESIEETGMLQINLESKGKCCILEITDNGKGISKENLDKIFQPFFTLKETGTGLGLVICKRIVDSFGGTIEVKSTEFVGTTVTIILPLKLNH
ncbi:ATP-binding protein [Neobacillus sp. LXY-1]|uniref:ATP-binding protein n=1 Tax=Neobacillus sp. LXY-1 TaxID=3379133 RepID=UPI003EE205C0